MVIFVNEDGSRIKLDDFVRYLLEDKEYNQLNPTQEKRLRLFLSADTRFIIGNVENQFPFLVDIINNMPPRCKKESDSKEGNEYENH